jgi:salicylate hydroxylase
MTNNKDQIIIVGAGIAGLSLAIQLAQKNIPSVVLESRTHFGGSTSGVRISTKGVKVLGKIGVYNIGESTEKLLMYFGSRQIAFDVKNAEDENSAIMVTRLAVFEKLWERISELKIPVLYNFKLDKVIENNESVEAIAVDGQSITGKYLVGADGVGSKVRSILNSGINSDKRYAGYLGIGFIYPSDDKIEMSLFSSINGNVGLGSIGKIKPNDSYKNNFLWTHIHVTETEAIAITDQEVYRQINERTKCWSPNLRQIFQEIRSNPKTVLYHQPVYNGNIPNKWYSDKLILIGDAAHPYGPGGQGISMALLDAEALCGLFVNGISEEDKFNFQTIRAEVAKSKGESAEDRNKPENQITSNFGLYWKYVLMKVVHLFNRSKMEL